MTMSESERKIVKETISDGVKITEYSDGFTEFKPLPEKTWWQKVKDWFVKHEAAPYIKIRDLADPFGDRNQNDDIDVGCDGKKNVEIGVKIKF